MSDTEPRISAIPGLPADMGARTWERRRPRLRNATQGRASVNEYNAVTDMGD